MSIIEKRTVEVYLNHTLKDEMDFTESVIADFEEMIKKFKELKNEGFKLADQPTVQKDGGRVFLSYKFTSSHTNSEELRERFVALETYCPEKIQLVSEPTQWVLNKQIEELPCSVRTYNCLKHSGANTLGDLIQKTEKELLRENNFGRKSLNELKEILAGMGLSLRG